MSKVKVLIIDDEEDFCENIGSFFKTIGLEVLTAGSLTDGLRLLEEQSPEVLFIDNNLPDGKGWELVDPITKTYPSLRLYLISAYHPSLPQLPNGVSVNVIEKPISFADLDKKLNHMDATNH